MRVPCAACGQPQPVDWRPGDLCVHCGQAVRPEVRCFWCAKWTPAAKFCRSCGAETVDERRYGAARMLKDAGTDRFSVPKMLRELDPDQVENFTRIYQRQAAVVARHVDDLRFLERFLRHKGYSGGLEDELIPQLPWPEATVEAMTLPPLPDGDLAAAKAVEASSPVDLTRRLAAVVRLRLGDFEAVRPAVAAFASSTTKEARVDAARALLHWRTVAWSEAAHPFGYRPEAEWLKALDDDPDREGAAAVRAHVGRGGADETSLREALASADPDTAFTAALAMGDRDRLGAALEGGDQLRQIAAGRRLAAVGAYGPLDGLLRTAGPDVREAVLRVLSRAKRPSGGLQGALLEILETSDVPDTRNGQALTSAERQAAEIVDLTVHAIAKELPDELAGRVARRARGHFTNYQALLMDSAGLGGEGVTAVLDVLLEKGRFKDDQWGLDQAIARGAVAEEFAPSRFARASDEMKKELAGLAEKQLAKEDREPLIKFLWNVTYGPHPAEVRAAGYWGIHRARRDRAKERHGDFVLRPVDVDRFFGSAAAFLPRLVDVFVDPATLKEVGLMDHLSDLLHDAPPEAAQVLAADVDVSRRLVEALVKVADGDYYMKSSALGFLSKFGGHEGWRAEADAAFARWTAAKRVPDYLRPKWRASTGTDEDL